MTCTCGEPAAHVCPAYIEARDGLIFAAERDANTVAPKPDVAAIDPRMEAWTRAWNAAFHAAMRARAGHAGLTR